MPQNNLASPSALNTISLAEVYDADRRTTSPTVRELAARLTIPHPLKNVAYADGVLACTHARKHQMHEFCPTDTDLGPDGVEDA